jgi:hypothetical protein
MGHPYFILLLSGDDDRSIAWQINVTRLNLYGLSGRKNRVSESRKFGPELWAPEPIAEDP